MSRTWDTGVLQSGIKGIYNSNSDLHFFEWVRRHFELKLYKNGRPAEIGGP